MFHITMCLSGLQQAEGCSCWESTFAAEHRASPVDCCWRPLRWLQEASRLPPEGSWHLPLLRLHAHTGRLPVLSEGMCAGCQFWCTYSANLITLHSTLLNTDSRFGG